MQHESFRHLHQLCHLESSSQWWVQYPRVFWFRCYCGLNKNVRLFKYQIIVPSNDKLHKVRKAWRLVSKFSDSSRSISGFKPSSSRMRVFWASSCDNFQRIHNASLLVPGSSTVNNLINRSKLTEGTIWIWSCATEPLIDVLLQIVCLLREWHQNLCLHYAAPWLAQVWRRITQGNSSLRPHNQSERQRSKFTSHSRSAGLYS